MEVDTKGGFCHHLLPHMEQYWSTVHHQTAHILQVSTSQGTTSFFLSIAASHPRFQVA